MCTYLNDLRDIQQDLYPRIARTVKHASLRLFLRLFSLLYTLFYVSFHPHGM